METVKALEKLGSASGSVRGSVVISKSGVIE